MPKHFKTHMISRLEGIISYYVPGSDVSATHASGVRYCVFTEGINGYFGKINTFKEGRKHKKHIIVRTWSRNGAINQIYTYHFPKHWSAACVANRELIKEAQRRAHAIEHDHSLAALEWHIRFFKHYFRVFKGGAEPEPGLKPYSRFYQYIYVVIYRELKAAQQQALQSTQTTRNLADEVAFEPVFAPMNYRPLRACMYYPLQRAIAHRRNREDFSPQEPLWRDFCKIVT